MIMRCALLILIPLYGSWAAAAVPPGGAADLRTTTPLMQGWKFIQDDDLTDDQALSSTAANWQTVTLPHTWNAKDAAGLQITKPYKRGIGWYRLEFDLPAKGAQHWLEFGAASMVADVWLNGSKLGQHKGGFTAFRFDVTVTAAPKKNVLLVKVDNRLAAKEDDPTAITPLAGDYNFSGGLYRHVMLISTREPVYIDLGDMGGPGVYASTKSLSGGDAVVNVRSKLVSKAPLDGAYVIRASFVEPGGKVVATSEKGVTLRKDDVAEAAMDVKVPNARLWQGIADPYQYRLVLDLVRAGQPVDRVVQNFGIRQMRIDPKEGFFLNGKHVRLHGVAIHQDYLGKGWAMTDREIDESFDVVKEIGANTVRLGHYPFSRYALERASALGLVAWSEVPYGIASTTELLPLTLTVAARCPTTQPTRAFVSNAKEQLQELIRQQFNHAAVAVWSVGNEITYMSRGCKGVPFDNVTGLLKELHALAKQEDPSRPTTHADFTEEKVDSKAFIHTGYITDVWATNRYFLWYTTSPISALGELLDAFRARYPTKALGVSEYGGGAALTHHSDNPLGGPAQSGNTGQPVAYQPEEFASYLHERNFAMLRSRKYLWATYVWNLFDFGSGIRNEGDTRGVNTKGLVTFDRKTRKDPFFFYKANWSRQPVTYITGRRYVDRAYPVTDVKVYSNADAVRLSVNGRQVGEATRHTCSLSTCVFKDVRLRVGSNEIIAQGDHGGKPTRDAVKWELKRMDVNIAAGQMTTGFKSSAGDRFGSDHFFTGGTGDWLVEKDVSAVTDKTAVTGTPDAQLFANFRRGAFRYRIPLADGIYSVTLGFLEPYGHIRPGDRVFTVTANGESKLENLDVLAAAGTYRKAVVRSFNATVSGGRLELNFKPSRGEAVVSNLSVKRVSPPLAGPASSGKTRGIVRGRREPRR